MREITLSKGYVAFVDDEDFDHLSQHKWSAMITGKHIKRVYAYRRSDWDQQKRRWRMSIFMHREIMNAPLGLDVDHQNGDTLFNLKSNLRCGTRSQNLANSRRAVGISGYRGVALTKRGEKAPYRVMCRSKYIGTYFNKIEAAKAYDAAALKEFGEFAKLNFPIGDVAGLIAT